MDKKRIQDVIEMVWTRYHANLAAHKMRQRPGRAEYQIELQKAGLWPTDPQAANRFYFATMNPKSSPLSRVILAAEKRGKSRRGK